MSQHQIIQNLPDLTGRRDLIHRCDQQAWPASSARLVDMDDHNGPRGLPSLVEIEDLKTRKLQGRDVPGSQRQQRCDRCRAIAANRQIGKDLSVLDRCGTPDAPPT